MSPSPLYIETSISDKLKKCGRHQQDIKKEMDNGLMDVPIPECKNDGSYKPLQCFGWLGIKITLGF